MWENMAYGGLSSLRFCVEFVAARGKFPGLTEWVFGSSARHTGGVETPILSTSFTLSSPTFAIAHSCTAIGTRQHARPALPARELSAQRISLPRLSGGVMTAGPGPLSPILACHHAAGPATTTPQP